MKVYTVHEPRDGDRYEPDPVLVTEGFCWPAFFFGVLWALAHRMVLVAALMAAAGIALAAVFALAGLHPLTGMAAWLAFALIVGFEANDWRRWTLARRGFETTAVVAAPGRDAALRRWADLNPALAAPVASAWPRG